jgi:hypothetical protein
MRSSGRIQERLGGRMVTGFRRPSRSADRIVAAGMPRMAAGDSPDAHPASPHETVLEDRLLGISRAGWLVPAARRQPPEQHSVEPDEPDPDSTRQPCHLDRGTFQNPSSTEEPTHRPDEHLAVGLDDRRPGDDEDVPAWLERGRHHPERLTESPARPVANHRAAQPPSSRQPEPGSPEVRPPESSVEQRVGSGDPLTLQHRKIPRIGEHHEPRRMLAAPVRQTVSRFRPLARRAARTRRPPVDFIRARKPCSLARCRFLGW